MGESGTVTVRMFGLLYEYRRKQGLPTTVDIELPAEGVSGRELARMLDIPEDRIEGVFCNRVVCSVDHVLRPGDRVAFVPYGTPGPHRFFLGLYTAGKEAEVAEE